MKKQCACNVCDTDFSKDNGYKYVLDELKATRAHLDDIIGVIEKRMEKDAIIDKVLNTDYEDEDIDLKNDEHETVTISSDDVEALDKLLKRMRISRRIYPWTSPYRPYNTWYY